MCIIQHPSLQDQEEHAVFLPWNITENWFSCTNVHGGYKSAKQTSTCSPTNYTWINLWLFTLRIFLLWIIYSHTRILKGFLKHEGLSLRHEKQGWSAALVDAEKRRWRKSFQRPCWLMGRAKGKRRYTHLLHETTMGQGRRIKTLPAQMKHQSIENH